jgi:hypothetical protein
MTTTGLFASSLHYAKELLQADDGAGIRCEMQYGQSTAMGVCETTDGKLYDMIAK